MIALLLSLALAQDLAVFGDAVHPVSGPVIADGVVLVQDGRIAAIGPAAEVDVPKGTPELRGAVVTPGLIDALGTAGLTGIENQQRDQDHAERDAPVRPELRAADGYDPWEPLLGWLRERGVTTVQTGPSPGAPVAGRTVVARTVGGPVDEVARVVDGAVVFTLGEAAKGRFADDGVATRMGAAAAVRQALASAREYQARRRLGPSDRPPVDLGMEALVEVLDGRRRAIFVAHRADDLLTALRIAEEHGLDVVLAGATEAWLVADAIAAAEAPVVLGPVMTRHWGGGERRHAHLGAAAVLADAGVLVAFGGAYEGYVPKVRVVLWEAAMAAANGLGPERALQALTLDAARVVGIDADVGSLEVGKRADVVVFDSDPFEYASHVCGVVIDGVVVSEACR